MRTERDGEVLVRDMNGLWWNRLGAFFRVSLQSTEGGTDIEIRPDSPLAMKVFSAVWLGGAAIGVCISGASVLVGFFGVRWGTGSPVMGLLAASLMFACGRLVFRSGRSRRDLARITDFVRRETDAAV